MKMWNIVLLLIYALVTQIANASPACLGSNGSNLPVMDDQVLAWKGSTQNQFLARAHVYGTLTQLYPDRNGHHHFQIQIGLAPSQTLEVVYNEDFGTVPDVRVGDKVEACGDYTTSNAPTTQYPASPDNAIIHWIHQSPNPGKHPSGFLIINGVLYGQGQPSH